MNGLTTFCDCYKWIFFVRTVCWQMAAPLCMLPFKSMRKILCNTGLDEHVHVLLKTILTYFLLKNQVNVSGRKSDRNTTVISCCGVLPSKMFADEC